MKKTDTIVGFIFLIIGIAIFITSFGFQQTLITDNYLGAAFFPRIIALCLSLVSVMLIVSSRKSKEKAEAEEQIFALEKMFRPLLVIAGLFLYMLIIKFAGFCISSTLLFWSILAVSQVKKPLFYLIAPLFIGVVYFVFRYLFLVQLPTGIVGF